jgi:putative DNA primase/helicase
VKADNISASGTFRTVEALSPVTLLIDEADTFLGQNEELRGILNSGFERNGEVIRVVEIKDEHQPVRFKTFAPCALAAIGTLPGTLEDRAIPVALQRRAVNETVVKLRAPGARAALHDLARRCARWANDRKRHLNPDPAVPEALGDREGDLAVPLLAIADDAGGPWPERMRGALVTIFGKRAADEGAADLATMLLADLREVFGRAKGDRLSSGQILCALWDLKERPWPEFRNGRALNAAQLAKLLRPFGIRPVTIRLGENETPKGYYREAFAEAWQRYLPPEDTPSALEGASEPPQRHNVGILRVSGEFGAATQGRTVAQQNSRKPAENKDCGGVADQTPPSGVKGGSPPGWRTIL